METYYRILNPKKNQLVNNLYETYENALQDAKKLTDKDGTEYHIVSLITTVKRVTSTIVESSQDLNKN